MAGKITCMGVHAALTLTIIVVTANIAIAHDKPQAPPVPTAQDTAPPVAAAHDSVPPAAVTPDTAEEVPAESFKVEAWFQANIAHKARLEPDLAAAEAAATVIKVKQDGSCQFKTITDAINSIPAGNTKRVIVNIGGGTYNEKITIPRNKPFVTLVGSAKSMPILTFAGTALKFGALNSATLIAEADYFVASNLVIKNDSPKPVGKGVGAQAVALRLSGNRAALYGCKMIGFQDTVCDDKGNHFFKDCYIEGAVDFIFGSGKSLYLSTVLHVLGEAGIAGMKYITGNARDSAAENTGYSFIHSNITGTGTSSGTLLGRAWKATAGAQIAYAFTSLGKSTVSSLGSSNDNKAQHDNNALFGEYQCIGPGSSAVGGAKFTKQLTHEQAKGFISLNYIQASKWLLPPPTPLVF